MNFSTGDFGDEVSVVGFPSVQFPASSPFSTAVGGTSLALNSDGTSLPGTKRLTPDIGWLADPFTGVEIVETVGGQLSVGVIGGTSLACPMFSALMSMAAQKAGHPIGQAAPLVYGLASSQTLSTPIYDVTQVSSPDNVTGTIDGTPVTADDPDRLGENGEHSSPFSCLWLFELAVGSDCGTVGCLFTKQVNCPSCRGFPNRHRELECKWRPEHGHGTRSARLAVQVTAAGVSADHCCRKRGSRRYPGVRFGLAKLLGPETADSSQTLTEVVHSDAGTVLGTVDYMSPEQVRAIGFGELRRIFLENRTHIGLDDLVKETEHVRSTGWLRRYPTLPDEYDRYDQRQAPSDEQMSTVVFSHAKVQARSESGGWLRLDHRELAACALAVSHAKRLVRKKYATPWTTNHARAASRLHGVIEKYRKRVIRELPVSTRKQERQKILADLSAIRQLLEPAVLAQKEAKCLRMLWRDLVGKGERLALIGFTEPRL